METVVIMLLFVLVALMGFLIWRTRGDDGKKERLESVLNDKFIDFSDRIRQTMDKTREEVEKSKDSISKSALKTLEHIASMNDVVGNLSRQQEKAQQLGQSLEYLLQAPKLRGNYGETILEEMLERILPKGEAFWERQYTIEGGEKVDAVVKYKDVVVPIDSKFPKEDYQKYLAASDTSEKKMHWANYEKALKTQINSIKEKYIKPEKGTTEFALLFIPSESIYYETIAEKNYLGDPCQINEYATQRGVIPVSPNTFYAFLHVVMLGIRNVEISREAKKLQESLSRVEKDFTLFYRKFELIGTALDKASEAYRTGDTHVQRFKKNLDSTLKLDKDFQGEISQNIPDESETTVS
ncbi:MAG: DNA recombination protein RmuC [Candidatus Omnitrophota bacterium]